MGIEVGSGRILLEIIEERAIKTPDKTAFTFHTNSPCTYLMLWRNISTCAGYLMSRGLKAGDRVVITIPNSDEFFFAFFGIQLAGGIPVPVSPQSGEERILKLADLSGSLFIIGSEKFWNQNGSSNMMREQGLILVEESYLYEGNMRFPGINSASTAFIQYTSGSTGDAKGVILSHDNLYDNILQMIGGLRINKKDIFISWLPVYHDMGLILMFMAPLYLGLKIYLLPTGFRFFKSWLNTIQKYKGTFTAAPDFVYRFCLRYVRDSDELDLSSLRVALNAAEIVRAGTINKFESRFSLKNVMVPAYGLAEATVGVCSWAPGKEVKVDDKGFVSVGKPFNEIELKINIDNRMADVGEKGDILVKSISNSSGYFNNKAGTETLFDEGGFVRTGDIGYVDEEGDYYIIGRKKNIIIQGGNNISSAEVEEIMDEMSFVRRSAAIGIDAGDISGEQVYIFLELIIDSSKQKDRNELLKISIHAVQHFKVNFGFSPGKIYLLTKGSIPLTHNGKIQYDRLKEIYIDGILRSGNNILFPGC